MHYVRPTTKAHTAQSQPLTDTIDAARNTAPAQWHTQAYTPSHAAYAADTQPQQTRAAIVAQARLLCADALAACGSCPHVYDGGKTKAAESAAGGVESSTRWPPPCVGASQSLGSTRGLEVGEAVRVGHAELHCVKSGQGRGTWWQPITWCIVRALFQARCGP